MKRTHGLSKTKIYGRWRTMRARCLNPNASGYDLYGGRGVSICERWLTFTNFLADMGIPEEGFSIERIDNDAGYSPENCRWATMSEQSNNRRSMRWITVDGTTRCLKDWCEMTGIKSNTFAQRIKYGWSEYDALFTPVRKSHG